MKDVEYVYHNFLSALCPSIKDVTVHEYDIKDVIVHEGNVKDVIFYQGDKLVMSVYASSDITVGEIERFLTGCRFFNITLEFIKYDKIPFSNLCLIEFEVIKDE